MIKWILLLTAAVLLWIHEYKQEQNDIRAEFGLSPIKLLRKDDGENGESAGQQILLFRKRQSRLR